MKWLSDEFDPHRWRFIRQKGKNSYILDHGILPGLAASFGFAFLLWALGIAWPPYALALIFALFVSPVHYWLCHRNWESNEDAFAQWIVDESRRLGFLARTDETGADED